VEGVDSQGRRTLQVGSLVLLPDEVLGYGSHGTVVYRGSLHGRPLAVKRVLSQFVKSADRYDRGARLSCLHICHPLALA
jgi:hypothetical protein